MKTASSAAAGAAAPAASTAAPPAAPLAAPPKAPIECSKCGACCVAPDISSLGKPLGVRCPHLQPDNLCAVYEDRPAVCRSYAADWLCERIAAPTLDERVRNYLAVFQL